jgi:ribonucleotide reductase beta subunit family protein with ferritin-like domain
MDLDTEPILQQSNNFCLFPIKHDDIWSMYMKSVDCFWRTEEIDLSKDLNDWNNKLDDNERYFLKMILAFFASSDGLVNCNLGERFFNEIGLQEAKCFYGFQIAMENIHAQTYGVLIDTYIRDENEKMKCFNAINEYDCIKEKGNWCLKYINSEDDFATRLICFAIVEGVFFSGAFCSIFWLKKRGLLQGLSFSNELISRDEALHTEFAVLLYSKLNKKVPKEKVYTIFRDAVKIEQQFITEALPCRLVGMNSGLMCDYIEFVADRLLVQLRYDKLWGTKNPFTWMEMISLEGKTNFFEKKVGDYALANKVGMGDEKIFDLEAAF